MTSVGRIEFAFLGKGSMLNRFPALARRRSGRICPHAAKRSTSYAPSKTECGKMGPSMQPRRPGVLLAFLVVSGSKITLNHFGYPVIRDYGPFPVCQCVLSYSWIGMSSGAVRLSMSRLVYDDILQRPVGDPSDFWYLAGALPCPNNME